MPASHVPSVTVVIPARNAADTLGAQLAALAAQREPPAFTVIVVDNGSTDGTAAVASSYDAPSFPVTVVQEPSAGINFARNAGVRAAVTTTVLLCDADDEVGENWVRSLSEALRPGVWVAGPLDFRRLNSERTRALWGGRDSSQGTGSEPFAGSSNGSNCGFHREMWQAIGEFDTTVVGHGDETEFFSRAEVAGYRQHWVPDAVVHHRQRSAATAMLRSRFRQGRSQVRMVTRPDWPASAPALTSRTALRSILGGVKLLSSATVHRTSVWPGAAAMALNLGRAWQFGANRIGRTRSATPRR